MKSRARVFFNSEDEAKIALQRALEAGCRLSSAEIDSGKSGGYNNYGGEDGALRATQAAAFGNVYGAGGYYNSYNGLQGSGTPYNALVPLHYLEGSDLGYSQMSEGKAVLSCNVEGGHTILFRTIMRDCGATSITRG